MKRFILSSSIAACSVLVWTATAGAKPNKKQEAQPAVAVKTSQPEATPLKA